jgi:hypothetical protein
LTSSQNLPFSLVLQLQYRFDLTTGWLLPAAENLKQKRFRKQRYDRQKRQKSKIYWSTSNLYPENEVGGPLRVDIQNLIRKFCDV